MTAIGSNGSRWGLLFAGIGMFLVVLWSVATGFYADRMLSASAARAVERGNRRGLFEARGRETFLADAHRPFGIAGMMLICFLSGALAFFPYSAP